MADKKSKQFQSKKPEPESTDPIEMLTKDHDKVKQLFREYESAGGACDRKQEIADEVFTELEIHSAIEEEIFYPALQDSGDEEGQKIVAEAIEEHRLVKQLISELRGLDVQDQQFDAKFKVLTENVEHHAEEEESEMFPEVEDVLEEELDELGARMKTRKEELKTSGLGEAAA